MQTESEPAKVRGNLSFAGRVRPRQPEHEPRGTGGGRDGYFFSSFSESSDRFALKALSRLGCIALGLLSFDPGAGRADRVPTGTLPTSPPPAALPVGFRFGLAKTENGRFPSEGLLAYG